MIQDREDLAKLAAIFEHRVRLAKQTEDEAVEEVRRDHRKVTAWVASKSEKQGAFLWFCDLFELDAGAVRKAIAEKKQ